MNKKSKEIIKKSDNLLSKQLLNYFLIFISSYKIEDEKLDLNVFLNCELYSFNKTILLMFFDNLSKKSAEIVFKEYRLKDVLLEKIFLDNDDIILDSFETEEKNLYLKAKKMILKTFENSDILISNYN